jgi:hypothetical protein
VRDARLGAIQPRHTRSRQICEGEVVVGAGLACGAPEAVSSERAGADVSFAAVVVRSGTVPTEDGAALRGPGVADVAVG